MKSLILLIASACVLLAVTVLAADSSYPQQASVVVGPSFVLKKKVGIPQEGVTSNMNTLQSNENAAVVQNTTSARGWAVQLVTIDKTTQEAMLYYYYLVNGTEVCYAYQAGTAPYPFPAAPILANFFFVKKVTLPFVSDNGDRVWPQYGQNVGRYIRRLSTNAFDTTPLPAGEPYRFYATNLEAMESTVDAQLWNNTETPASVFAVPAVCASVSRIRKLRHQHHESALAILALKQDELVYDVEAEEDGNIAASFDAMIHENRARLQAVGKDLLPYPLSGSALPTAVDNRPYVTSIRDQAMCGGCWAFSSAALSELVYNYRTRNTQTWGTTTWWISVQNLLDCASGSSANGTVLFPSKGCFGGWPLVALSYIVANGVLNEDDYSFDGANGAHCLFNPGMASYPLSAAWYIPYAPTNSSQNIPLLMDAIVNYGGVIAIMNANPILYYGGGYVFSSECKPSLGHAVVLVGYGTDPQSGMDYWLVKNSFGANWGEAGFFRIQRGVNLCGIEQMGFVGS